MIVCRQCRRTSRALDLYNRFFPFNLGMIAPGNHWDFDSLRAAPPARCRSMVHASVRNASLPPALVRGVVRVAHTGTGGSPYNRLHLQDSCHSEPVLKLVWESPSSLRTRSSKDGDCHASVSYFIAMTRKSGTQ